MFKNKTILITGGTGTLGQGLVKRLLPLRPKKIIIFSRDEFKQYNMQLSFNSEILRYILGDVRDLQALTNACKKVDYIIHTAALKQVPALEYNPQEAVKTNVLGAVNVIQAAIENKIKKVIALSTDKAVNPINLYGATKLCSDKLFLGGNALSGAKTLFSVVRYGNVEGSRGSVIPYFKSLCDKGDKTLPVTHDCMTRFNITLDQAIDLIFTAFETMEGGEVYVAKIPSFKIIDLVKYLNCNYKITGIRAGEKLHEIMITSEDAPNTRDFGDYYIIYPQFDWISKRKKKGKPVLEGFSYSSDTNTEWLYVSIRHSRRA
jgi:UDP-N-acetylglucosamine 4,6-dehydratase (inverting)